MSDPVTFGTILLLKNLLGQSTRGVHLLHNLLLDSIFTWSLHVLLRRTFIIPSIITVTIVAGFGLGCLGGSLALTWGNGFDWGSSGVSRSSGSSVVDGFLG
jgi:hypothetical protein